jgi:hypothetical protein
MGLAASMLNSSRIVVFGVIQLEGIALIVIQTTLRSNAS